MKCEHCKRMIYLYDVLDDREKRKFNEHISFCAACQRELERVREMKEYLNSISPARAFVSAPANPASVNQVMRGIIDVASAPMFIQRCYAFLQVGPMRYALAAVSAVMIMFFISEFRRGSITKNTPVDTRGTVALTQDLFHRQSRRALREKPVARGGTKSLFYEYVTACREKTDDTCADCKNRCAKIKSYGI